MVGLVLKSRKFAVKCGSNTSRPSGGLYILYERFTVPFKAMGFIGLLVCWIVSCVR
jgi:hypothetical protein